MQDIMNKPENKSARKNLRNCSTSAEATLWKLIKDKQIDGLKFRRQHSVGSYILDFYCPKLRLDIELDGEVHSTSEAMDYADARARFLINETSSYSERCRIRNISFLAFFDGIFQLILTGTEREVYKIQTQMSAVIGNRRNIVKHLF